MAFNNLGTKPESISFFPVIIKETSFFKHYKPNKALAKKNKAYKTIK